MPQGARYAESPGGTGQARRCPRAWHEGATRTATGSGRGVGWKRRAEAVRLERRQRFFEVLAVLRIGELLPELPRLLFLVAHLVVVPGNAVRAGERFVRERKIPVLHVLRMRTTDLEAPLGVIERRLRPTQHGVDARAQPLAAGPVLRLTLRCLPPVVRRGVRHVEHPLVVLARLHEPPRRVEQLNGKAPVIALGHDSLLGRDTRTRGVPSWRSLTPRTLRLRRARGSPPRRPDRPAWSCPRAGGSQRRPEAAAAYSCPARLWEARGAR